MINKTSALIKMQEIIQSLVGVKISEQLQKKLLSYLSENYAALGFKNEEEFVQDLATKSISSPEIRDLINRITIAESYFFRHKRILSFLEKIWLPRIVKSRRQENNLNLRIWSAGCSAGQELYSIAICLQKNIDDIEKWNIHLLGTDIDSNSLLRAKLGQYRSWSFRDGRTPEEEYFFKQGENYFINEKVKKMTNFQYLNLVDNNYPSITNGTNNIDLILCCNVLIYLTADFSKLVLERFSSCLASDGLLILGPSDIVSQVPECLVQYQDHEITYYKKTESILNFGGIDFPVDETSLEKKYAQFLSVLFKQLNAEQWISALNTIVQCEQCKGENALLFQLKANALANLGELKSALIYANKSLILESNDSHTYLIRAMIYLGLKNLKQAEQDLRQALIINGDFVEIRFHLGLLLLGSNRFDEGLALLYSAKQLIKNYDPNRKVHHAPRLNFQDFAKIIDNEIAVYEAQAQGKTDE